MIEFILSKYFWKDENAGQYCFGFVHHIKLKHSDKSVYKLNFPTLMIIPCFQLACPMFC